MLVILAALSDEIRLIKSEMEVDKAIHTKPFSVFTGKFQEKKISIVRTGVGKERMRGAIEYCVKNLEPSLMINIGYAGGLDPHLQVGDIVAATAIIDEVSERSWEVNKKLVGEVVSVSESSEIRCHNGKIVTVDQLIGDPHQKAFVGTRFGAIACDMESAPFAEVASASKVPFLVVRSVLDSMDTALPEFPSGAMQGGEVGVGQMLSHLKTNPKDILKLPKISYLATQARISITNFVKEWIKHEHRI